MFKAYTQSQPSLLPPSLDDLIPEKHPVRVVSRVVDGLDLSSLISVYEGGGASSYHPRMLLKVVVYAYLRNVYSTRKMEEQLSESVHFMWLAGGNRPDHNTLARFRSRRLKDGIKDVFRQVVSLLAESGHVSLEEAYIDGTKLEANAGRYTFVWGRSIKTNKEKMLSRVNELLAYADRVCESESGSPPVEFEEISAEKIRETVEKIDEALKGKDVPKTVRRQLGYAKRRYPEAAERYEKQEEILGGRNSCSKTDPDATFMRMKEDHMGNGQLKPGYNLQISTENQFVTCFSVHSNPTDVKTLPSHLDGFAETCGKLPGTVVADAGYGSLENYEYFEEKGVEGYVKDPWFDRDRRGKDPFQAANWPFDEEAKSLICPAGKPMAFRYESKNGTLHFAASDCEGCPLRDKCLKGSKNRTATRNPKLEGLRQKARDLLCSEKGIRHRKRRCHEPETVFGQIKHNKGFRRLSLRGKDKVFAEIGILLLAHNLQKLAA